MNEDFLINCTKGWWLLQQVAARSYHYNERECVYRCDKLTLYHYRPKVKRPHSRPLLVVFATVNRPEILDLFPSHSFIGGLLEQGLDVYLLDWGYPLAEDSNITLGDYVLHYLKNCIDYICEQHKKSAINVLGVCQGGLICLCFASLYSSIKNLILISAPIDCSTPDNKVANILHHIDAENMLATTGNVSGQWLSSFFISLRPFELVGLKYLRLADHVNDDAWLDQFLQVEKWLNDAPDQAGAAFMQFVRDCYQQNKLIKNELILNEQCIYLNKVTLPILNVMASEDDIVPTAASSALKHYVRSADYTEQFFSSGHIGIYVSQKVGAKLASSIAEWIKNRK